MHTAIPNQPCVPLAAAIVLAAVAAPALAREQGPDAIAYTVDCSHRALPSQRVVGEWNGEHNFGQAYAARQRLVAKILHACDRPGIERLQLTLRASDADRAAAPLLASAGAAHAALRMEGTP